MEPSILNLKSSRSGHLWTHSKPAADAVVLVDATLPLAHGESPVLAVNDRLCVIGGRGLIYAFHIDDNKYECWRVGKGGANVTSLAFTSHGKELAVTLEGGSVYVLNARAGGMLNARLHHFRAGSTSGNAVFVSSSDGLLVTRSVDRVVLWKAPGSTSWVEERILEAGPQGGFQGACICGKKIVVQVRNKILGWWTGTFELAFEWEHDSILSCFAASSLFVVAACGPLLYFVDAATATVVRIVELPSSVRTVVQLEVLASSSASLVAVLCDDGRLLIVDNTAQGGCTVDSDLTEHITLEGPPLSFATSRRYGIVGHSKAVQIVDLQNARRASKVDAPVDPSLCARSGNGGTLVASRVFAPARASKAVMLPASKPPAAYSLSPPHELTKTLGKDAALTQGRVRDLVEMSGELPAKYRPLCWRYLLKLPENEALFAALVAKGPHPAYRDISARYPLRDSRLLRRLGLVLSALGHWSPIVAELEYVPATAFPFVLAFENDDLAAFEASMAVICRWQRFYLATYPHPPVPLLGAIEAALHLHDPKLIKHLENIRVRPQDYAWPILRSCFTEVLGKGEWLVLVDHVFAASDQEHSNYLAVAAVAFVLYSRTTLVSMQSSSEVDLWIHAEQPINAATLLKCIKKLQKDPPTCAILGEVTLRVSAEDSDSGEVSSTIGSPPWPIPKGSYPPLRGFPRFALDYQLQQRDRLAEEEEAMRVRQDLVATVQARANELTVRERAFAEHRRRTSEVEEARRHELQAAHNTTLKVTAQLALNRKRAALEGVLSAESEAWQAQERSMAASEQLEKRSAQEVAFAVKRSEVSVQCLLDEESAAQDVQHVTMRLRAMAEAREEEDRARAADAEVSKQRDDFLAHESSELGQWHQEDASREEEALALSRDEVRWQKQMAAATERVSLADEFSAIRRECEGKLAVARRLREARQAKEAELRNLLENSADT